MSDSGKPAEDAFPESDVKGPDSGRKGTPTSSGGGEGQGSGCRSDGGGPGIEAILRGLDRFFIQECIKRLGPQEKEGKPHE